MSNQIPKQFFFDVQLNWISDTKGLLTAKDTEGSIHVATPPEFGGSGKPWTPEHLFLGSISSCYMSTYLSLAKKMKFEISHFSCDAIGKLEIIDGRFMFTTINLYPKIFIADEEIRDKANLVAEKTHKHCLITNSVSSEVVYHTEILTIPENEEVENDQYEHRMDNSETEF